MPKNSSDTTSTKFESTEVEPLIQDKCLYLRLVGGEYVVGLPMPSLAINGLIVLYKPLTVSFTMSSTNVSAAKFAHYMPLVAETMVGILPQNVVTIATASDLLFGWYREALVYFENEKTSRDKIVLETFKTETVQ